ncbi:MAG TPA: heparan-alpha-glucosaminide N-acetyltransferase [Bauldia sp.]|nr:heparan-alpha-glucosaminide N-acetyltransferase [Bauldia sp.]
MSTIASATIAERSPRVAVIDVVKGAAILAMIVYHFAWDLSAYRLIAVDVTTDLGWRFFARTIAATFLAMVGVNLVLATRAGLRPGPYVRRLAIILAAALLVTLGTWWLDPNTFVFFGILHAIFVASILALPFLRAPVWLILVAAVFFLAGPGFLRSPFFDAPGWYWLGLSPNPPATVDYVPLFPWFGAVLAGIALGRLIVARPDLPLWRWPARSRVSRLLAAAGRWSLAIYLIHQPVLIGSLMLVAPLLGPSEAALRRQVFVEFEASCAAVGYERPVCEAYAACILAELDRHQNILSDAARHTLSDADQALWLRYVEQCRTKILPVPSLSGAI